MARTPRYHLDNMPAAGLVPKHLTKEEFGRRLYTLIMSKGWNQSELARRAGLPRDSISTYVRGRTFPTPKSLRALADALGIEPADLLPNSVEVSMDEDVPSLEMKVSTGAPDRAWLRVNRLVTLRTAAQVIELVQSDEAGGAPADTD